MDSSFQKCKQLIVERMGLHMRQQDAELLEKTLRARISVLKLSSVEAYCNLLSDVGGASEAEWKQLFILLTNQESYFFRDQGQFHLLRHQILPELIARNGAQPKKSLRIWSAGCSTGEEPYSLAILLDLLLPLRTGWEILILGTDLSEKALETARLAQYGSWSFRALERSLQERYFHPHQKRFQLDARIRDLVTFRHGNLLQDPFPLPNSPLHNFDLIVCRNVFIYFRRAAVASILRKFDQSLNEGGYLMTGHAELHDTPLGQLRAHSFPQSVIFQKDSTPLPTKPASPPKTAPLRAVPSTLPVKPRPLAKPATPLASSSPFSRTRPLASPPTDEQLIAQAFRGLQKGNPTALASLAPLLERAKPHFAAHCLAAQAQANAGRYDMALVHCEKASEADVFAPLPYLVKARIAQEKGELENAKTLLKKVIYLAPQLAEPYLELAALYALENDETRARKMRATAREAVARLQASDFVPKAEWDISAPLPVGELRDYLERN